MIGSDEEKKNAILRNYFFETSTQISVGIPILVGFCRAPHEKNQDDILTVIHLVVCFTPNKIVGQDFVL